MKIFLILLGIYVLYKFLVDFAIPIYKTSKRVQQQFRNMNNMNRNPDYKERNKNSATTNPDPKKAASGSKDYIDFEEVKD